MSEPFRVLIAIDTSEHAEYAFKYYIDNLHKEGNEVILVHLAELPSTSTFMSGGVWEEMVQHERDRTRALEVQYKEKLDQKGIHGKMTATFGNKPGEVIVHTANNENVDMIVVGSRGLGKLRRTIMGSVSDYVLHHAHCTVVVCKHEHHHHHHHGFHLPSLHHHHHHNKHGKHHNEDEGAPPEEDK